MRRYPLFILLFLVGCSVNPTADPGPPAATSEAVTPADSAETAVEGASDIAVDPCHAGDARACFTLCMEEAEKCGGDIDKCDQVASEVPACSSDSIQPGSLCVLEAAEVAPTQGAVGEVAATCKADKIAGKNTKTGNKLKRYLLERPVPAILGPGDRFFITDRHHLSWGLLNADIEEDRKGLFICQMADKRSEDVGDFWKYMAANNFAWLRDNRGAEIGHTELPTRLADLSDDPYRTLSRWVRDSCGYVKCDETCGEDYPSCQSAPSQYYLEFVWADYMRTPLQFPGIYDKQGQDQVDVLRPHLKDAINAVLLPAADDLPGWNDGSIKSEPPVPVDPSGCEE